MTDNYSIEELKALLLKEEIDSYEPRVQLKKQIQEDARNAIDERGIPELHDIMAGRKTANMSDIAKKYDPSEGLTKEFWHREPANYNFKDLLLIIHQGLLHSNSYLVIVAILYYIIAF